METIENIPCLAYEEYVFPEEIGGQKYLMVALYEQNSVAVM